MNPPGTSTSTLIGDDFSRAISRQVQYNCAISDALYAREYTLCIYLLRMREFYRWQNNIPFGRHLSLDDVGDWVTQTEQYWDEIEQLPFRPIRIGETDLDPFDSELVNSMLQRYHSDDTPSLIYSAGLGRRGQPHFLLATGQRQSDQSAVKLNICTVELARDINAPVAMARDGTIVISRAGLQRMLWELYEEWSFHRNDGPMARLSQHYGWTDTFSATDTLEQATTELMEVLIAHERGEVAAADHLPDNWTTMAQSAIATNGSSPTPVSLSNELYLRAVRDNLADSLRTWPMIVESGAPVLLDFWLAGLGPVRKQMLEATDFKTVLTCQHRDERLTALAAVTQNQSRHWKEQARAMSEAYARGGAQTDLAKTITGCERRGLR